jgi:putative membrane protein
MAYLYLKWLHIIAIVSWMAGILYFYRLLVYHHLNKEDANRVELLSIMEHKLYNYITVPSMICSWIFGLGMIHLQPALILNGKWLWVKILLVFFLTGTTHMASAIRKKFLKNSFERYHQKKLRILNEVPMLLFIVISYLVIFKNF